MTEEAKVPDPEVSTTPETTEPIDRTELAQLRTNSERLARLDEMGGTDFDAIEDYVGALEDDSRERLETQEQAPAKVAPPKSPAPQTPAQPAPTGPDQQTIQNTIDIHRVEFKLMQGVLPEEQRTTHKIEDLTKVLFKQGPLVVSVSKSTGGNMFAAASKILDLDGGAVAGAVAEGRADGAAIEKAKAGAVASTNLPTGGGVPLPKTDTPEEQAANIRKAELDRMIPDDPVQDFG